MLDINKTLYDFLKDKIPNPYQLRYPFQESAINYHNGYFSWYELNTKPISTVLRSQAISDKGLLNNIEKYRFQTDIMLECERVLKSQTDYKNAFSLMVDIRNYLNSYLFIEYYKDKEFESLPINDSIIQTNFYAEQKEWIQKASVTLSIISYSEISYIDSQVEIDYSIKHI